MRSQTRSPVAALLAIVAAVVVAAAVSRPSVRVHVRVDAFLSPGPATMAPIRQRPRRSTPRPNAPLFVAKDVIPRRDPDANFDDDDDDDDDDYCNDANSKANAKANAGSNRMAMPTPTPTPNKDTPESMIIVVGKDDRITLTNIDPLREHERISPMDGNHVLRYLDPLRKKVPNYHERKRERKRKRERDSVGAKPRNHRISAASDSFPATGNAGRLAPNGESKSKARADAPLFPRWMDRDSLERGWADPSGPEPNSDAGNPRSSTSRWELASFALGGVGADADAAGTADADAAQGANATTSAARAATISLSCGSYRCTRGGWHASSNNGNGNGNADAGTTSRVYWVRTGFACLTDRDGERHYFGPGDTLIVPGGWSGRWDVAEELHAVWFEHKVTEAETSGTATDANAIGNGNANGDTVRARVIHYHELMPPHIPARVHRSENVLYERERERGDERQRPERPRAPLRVSCLLHTPYDPAPGRKKPGPVAPPDTRIEVGPRSSHELVYLLEGAMLVEGTGASGGGGKDGGDERNDEPLRVSSGDVLVLPEGWAGTFALLEPVKVLRMQA